MYKFEYPRIQDRMKTVSCKVTSEMGSKLEAATAERDVFRSELIRAAIRHYVATNPDGYTVFEKEGTPDGRRDTKTYSDKRSTKTESPSHGEIYDPTEGRYS